jgi:hypothetical protein
MNISEIKYSIYPGVIKKQETIPENEVRDIVEISGNSLTLPGIYSKTLPSSANELPDSAVVFDTEKDVSLHVVGDVGEFNADYEIRKDGNVTHVVGDVGEFNADYEIVQNANTTQVKGDVGEFNAGFEITQKNKE